MGERRQRLDMIDDFSMGSRPNERTAFLSLEYLMDFDKNMHVFSAVCSYLHIISVVWHALPLCFMSR